MIVAGFGFRAAATTASLADAFQRAGGRAEVFASAADKATSKVFIDFATGMDARVLGVTPDSLAAQRTLTQSHASQAARDTGSLAEAAALAAAGPGAKLLAPRVVSADRMATCALAEGDPI
ncbi:cobalamin biosynthesis protein [Jannaschia sp. CCS1]|uniref:cobalamin biosynthesis protein n=1 Tax=Jannaschia sp. (strain CCS1) TaxID=290400 RepID=UPI000053CD1C|nr:cobalamin biosynthesis protein [Jannaschia sp. CCS1]ABD55841.1 cobalamin biosynthesis domain protein [Jannaschia sp. CCS1]